MAEKNEENKKDWEISGLFIPAGLFMGMGVGWALGYLVQGIFIGLGVGFCSMAIMQAVLMKKK
ncbi:MAG: hypothetical protein P8078_10775 [bacterium]